MPNSKCEEREQGWVHKRWQGRLFVFTSILVTSSTSQSADVIYSCFSSSVFPTSGLVVKLHLKACWRTKICFSIDPTIIENNRSYKSIHEPWAYPWTHLCVTCVHLFPSATTGKRQIYHPEFGRIASCTNYLGKKSLTDPHRLSTVPSILCFFSTSLPRPSLCPYILSSPQAHQLCAKNQTERHLS